MAERKNQKTKIKQKTIQKKTTHISDEPHIARLISTMVNAQMGVTMEAWQASDLECDLP